MMLVATSNGRNGHEQETITRRNSRATAQAAVPPQLLACIDGPLGDAKAAIRISDRRL
jgi:hypothetical protein